MLLFWQLRRQVSNVNFHKIITFRYPDVTHNAVEQRNLTSRMFSTNFTRSQILQTEQQQQRRNQGDLMRLYKAPPPYPSNKISSNSTPDLACISQPAKRFSSAAANAVVSGSSPDLVSTSNFYLKHYGQIYQQQGVHRSQSYLPGQHDTYENLATIFNNNNLMANKGE